MSRFRDYNRSKNRGSASKYLTYIILISLIGYGTYYFWKNADNTTRVSTIYEDNVEVQVIDEDDFLPSSKGEIVRHQYYTLSYLEEYEQAEWVAYKLTRELLRRPNVPRSDWFKPDPNVKTGSARHFDYSGSGYTRGHLVPSGDMSFDKTAEAETFFMSNMTPQIRSVNNGIWKELEEQTRDWTFQNEEVIIISGPLFDRYPQKIKNKVGIPTAFYKIVLDTKEPVKKAIAFLIPHKMSERPLQEYAMTVDSLESISGIDFFPRYIGANMSNIESNLDLSLWPISEARYRLRVEKWNHE